MKKSINFKYANIDDVANGAEKIRFNAKETPARKAQADVHYEEALSVYDYYVHTTGYSGKNTRNSTAQSIVKLLKTRTKDELIACVDRYLKDVQSSKYAYAPHNFFGRFDVDKAYYRNYLDDAIQSEDKGTNTIVPTFREV